MQRPEHPFVVLVIEMQARRFGIDPRDLWDWMDRKKKAPRWFVDAVLEVSYPSTSLRETDFDIDESLTSRGVDSTLGTVETSSNTLRSKAKLTAENRKHLAVRRLAKLNVTMVEVAAVLTQKLKRKVPLSTVRSWYKDPKRSDYRGIPADAAAACKAEWDIPESAWHRIIPAVD